MKLYTPYIVIFLLIAFGACKSSVKENAMPNVVLVLTDDQGWGDVGFNGNQVINTPCLDSLATNGVVFDRFYVSPVCAPTRSSLLTGKYHLATGTTWVTHRKEVMRESEITIAEILRANGFNTGCFGKWHNGAQYPHNPNGQGFDTFFGFSAGHWNRYFDAELEYNGSKVQTKGYIADVITDSVNSFITNSEEPFFAYVAYNTPHTPYQVDDVYFNKYTAKGLDSKMAAIYGMCENIDDNVARIQATLKAVGKQNNTVFIFMSDNGPNFIRYNGNFKGRKAQVDEGGVRVPFLISYPDGNFPLRRITNNFGTHMDVLPTILDICNLPDQNLTFDGISLKETIANPKAIVYDRPMFSHHIMSNNAFCGAVRTNQYLLTCYPNDTTLYDVLSDPYQKKDITANNGNLVDSLSNAYATWLVEVSEKGLEPEPIMTGYSTVSEIDFPAHEAHLYGDVIFSGGAGWANDWVSSFNDSQDSITWDIEVKKYQRYKAKLKFACGVRDIGKTIRLTFGEHSITKRIVNVESAPVIPNDDRVNRVEVVERAWGELDFGTLYLNEETTSLALNYEGRGNSNIEIKELILNTIQ